MPTTMFRNTAITIVRNASDYNSRKSWQSIIVVRNVSNYTFPKCLPLEFSGLLAAIIRNASNYNFPKCQQL